ncbi:MAG TPA: DUF4433 domain-containing protein [Streptosporangiaceae bacterium]|nr:DUF4433 domain-containing protein [Streptosporangiaceae bacterium]
MKRSRVTELHYITPVANLQSIMKRGILSHRRAETVSHESVADEDVQDRRRGKRVPNGRMLHEYVNVYFDARNPMMYKRLSRRAELAVVRVVPSVLDIQGAVIADGNAASSGTRFDQSPEGLALLDEQRVFADYWTHVDTWEHLERKRQRCAELLIPDRIPSDFLNGCYVCSAGAQRTCRNSFPEIEVVVNGRVFFT